jgi:tetratricopeptide (TPR) repeat protein
MNEPPLGGWRPREGAQAPKHGEKVRPAVYRDDMPGPKLPPAEPPTVDKADDPKEVPKKKDATDRGTTLPPPKLIIDPKKKPDADAILLLAAARNAVARGEIVEAIGRFEEYLQIYPDDREVRGEYAGLLVQVDRYKAAVEEYRKLLADEPDNLTLIVSLADVYLVMKDYRKAAAQLLLALEKAPRNLEYAVKLARAYAFDGDVSRAFQVFDRYLGRYKTDDARLPKSYGALLIDLGQLDSAVAFLSARRKETPDDLEVLAFLIRAYARRGDRPKAFEAIADLAERKPTAIPVRLELAESLLQSTDFEAAILAFAQVLRTAPENALANIGMARVLIAQFLTREGAAILSRLNPTGTPRRIFLLAWAEYHQAVGEYSQGKQIYKTFLSKDESDSEARLALAKLYAFTREDEKAKAEYARVSTESSQARAARRGIVEVLLAQRRFPEALELSRLMVRENPSDGPWRALAAQVLLKSGDLVQADAICREFLNNETRYEPAVAEVRLMLGKILLERGKSAEAAAEFEQALAGPYGRVAAGFYGLARAQALLGFPDRRRALHEAAVAILGDPRGRLLMADQFVADHEDGPAGEFCEAVLVVDRSNLPALIRLADIRQRQASFTADIAQAVAVCDTILHLSPKNVRGLLALARSLTIVKKYSRATATYEELIVVDADFTVPKRERARVLFSDNAYASAVAAYAELEHAPIQELLRIEAGEKPSKTPPYLMPYLVQRTSADILHGEIGGMLPPPADVESLAPFQRVLHESAARTAEASGAALEGKAKYLKNWRNYTATPIYQQLLMQEPANTEAAFDLAQIYSAQRHTVKAINTYNELLQIDPLHRDGIVARERASLERQPQGLFDFSYFGQRGRDNLAAIDRTLYRTAARLPFRDEDEYVEAAFTRAHYDPVGGPAIDGNILTSRAQVKIHERWLFYGQVNFESYDRGGFSDRVTFNTGGKVEPCDELRLFANGFLENVVESAGSIDQDIYRGGIRVGGDIRPARRWDLGGEYMVAVYSDKNTVNSFRLYNEVILCFLPRQLKFVTTIDYMAYAHQSIQNQNDPNNSLLAVHPYFAPAGFALYEGRLEWLHYFSRDYFAHSNVCYYGLQAGLAWDNQFRIYQRFALLFNFDVKPWLSIGAESNYTSTNVYQQVGAHAYLVLRLPHFHR